MKTLGCFDADLQMFIEEPRELDQAHLEFLKYLIAEGILATPRKVDAELAQAEASR